MAKAKDTWEPAKSVGWYDPVQLLRTGLQVVGSSLFAENADGRLVQPLFDPVPAPHDERFEPGQAGPGAERAALTLDYIADTGDGFDATYTVAYHATASLDAAPGGPTLAPGQVLVLGGDGVYPTASKSEYEGRLVRPLAMASARFTAEGGPTLYAIPGNHDWYDNLVAFRRLFVHGQRVGGFASRQRRSYFVLRLPHGWWLFAPDVQLGSEIDVPQYEYLKKCVDALPADARVILCTAEPHWVYANEALRNGTDQPETSKLLIALEEAIDGETGRLRAALAGDLHHYRRHTGRIGRKVRDVQLITAGGGGAFLHPTHGWRDGSDPSRPVPTPGYRLEKAFPDPETSRKLARGLILGFPFENAAFLWASAAVYGAMSLQIVLGARVLCADDVATCGDSAALVAASPGAVTLAALIVAGFAAFTDTSSRVYRWAAGLTHGFLHAAIATAVPVAAVDAFGAHALGLSSVHGPWAVPCHVAEVICTLLGTTGVGALAGGFVMGLYLFVSLNVFGRHRNEAFSGLRSPRFKSFLRIVIDERGAHIHAFGIDEPPREWVRPRDAGDETIVRLEPRAPATPPVLVDDVRLT